MKILLVYPELPDIFNSISRIGIAEFSTRSTTLLFYCDPVPLAITFAIYGFYFRQVVQLHIE